MLDMRKNFGAKTYVYPQPVLIIGTYDENGKPDAMNAAWGGICGADKIMIELGSHQTSDNIAKTNAFTVAVADKEHVVECDYVGVVSGRNEPDKMKKAGFTTVKSEFVNAPVINELPLTLECELEKKIDGMYIGKIVNVSADEKFLGADGLPDVSRFVPITFDPVHHKYIALDESVGNAFSDGKKIK